MRDAPVTSDSAKSLTLDSGGDLQPALGRNAGSFRHRAHTDQFQIAVESGAIAPGRGTESTATRPRLSRVSDPRRFRPFITSLDGVIHVAPLLFASSNPSSTSGFWKNGPKLGCGTTAATRSSVIAMDAKASVVSALHCAEVAASDATGKSFSNVAAWTNSSTCLVAARSVPSSALSRSRSAPWASRIRSLHLYFSTMRSIRAPISRRCR